MSSPTISVIIPIYNSESTLDKCIQSILNQTFKDFEIILINDGSTDESIKICRKYAKNNSRVRFINKENGGVSSARNSGIDIAKGDWICFVDSDDLVLENYLQDMFRSIGPGIDLVIQGFIKIKDGEKQQFDLGDGILSAEDYLDLFDQYKIIDFGFVVSKLYRSSLIKRHKVRFPIDLSHAEDLIFLLSYIPYSCKIVFNSVHNYIYINNSNSLVNTFQNPKTYYQQYNLLKTVIKNQYQEVFRSVYLENTYHHSHTSKVQFATLLKFMKAMYYHKLSIDKRLGFLHNLDENDLKLLEYNIKTINNPILFIAYKFLTKKNFHTGDQLLSIYYSILSKLYNR